MSIYSYFTSMFMFTLFQENLETFWSMMIFIDNYKMKRIVLIQEEAMEKWHLKLNC